MSMYLTPAQLADLTGLTQPAAQIKWLEKRGWKFERTAQGQPRVTVAYHAARLETLDSAAPAAAAASPIWHVRPQLVAVK